MSASMLKDPVDYGASLEALSRPLMPLVEYTLDEDGRMVPFMDMPTGSVAFPLHRTDHRYRTE
jgi:hypothetical protein